MDISIRKGTKKDSELISRIYAESWRSAYKGMVPDEYLNDLKDDFWVEKFQMWISEDIFKVKIIYADNKAAGAAAYGKSRDEKFADYAEICSFYLIPEYFRKGLGTALMKSVIDEIYNEGYKHCYLWVLDANSNARMFYENMGFRCNNDQYNFKILNKDLTDLRYILDLQHYNS